jgi:hypothetical protein
MIDTLEMGLKEIWDIKEEMYSDFKASNFTNYYDFIKNEIKNLNYKFYENKATNNPLKNPV